MGTVYTQLSMHERRRIEGWWLPIALPLAGHGGSSYSADHHSELVAVGLTVVQFVCNS